MRIKYLIIFTFFYVHQEIDLYSQNENIIEEYKNLKIYHDLKLNPINTINVLDTLSDYKERFFESKDLNKCYGEPSDGKCIEYFKKFGKKQKKEKAKFDKFRLIEYKDGFAIGKVYDFNKDSTLNEITIYDKNDKYGKMYSIITFHNSENIYTVGRYSNDKYCDLYEFYHDNGNPMMGILYSRKTFDEFYYNNYIEYYESGKLKYLMIVDSINDYIYYKCCRENGTIEFEEAHKNDLLIRLSYDDTGSLTEKIKKEKGSIRKVIVEYYQNDQLIDTREEVLKHKYGTKDFRRKEKKRFRN